MVPFPELDHHVPNASALSFSDLVPAPNTNNAQDDSSDGDEVTETEPESSSIAEHHPRVADSGVGGSSNNVSEVRLRVPDIRVTPTTTDGKRKVKRRPRVPENDDRRLSFSYMS